MFTCGALGYESWGSCGGKWNGQNLKTTTKSRAQRGFEQSCDVVSGEQTELGRGPFVSLPIRLSATVEQDLAFLPGNAALCWALGAGGKSSSPYLWVKWEWSTHLALSEMKLLKVVVVFFFFFRHVRMPQANWPYCDERVSVKCVTWLCERWLLCSSLSGPPCFGSFLLWGGKMRRREALKVSAETNRTDQGALQLTWIHLGLWRVWAQVMSHLWCLCCSCTGVVHLCAQVTMQRSSKMNTKDTQICNSTRILDISLIIKSESMHLVSIWICV